MLQQQGVSQERARGLRALLQEPWHTASPLSPTRLMPPLLIRPKPTETSPPTNSPPCRRQHIPSPLETTPSTSQHQTQPDPPVHRQRQFDLMWSYTVLFLRSHITSPGVTYPQLAPSHPHPRNTHIPPSSSSSPPLTCHPLPLPSLPHNVSNNCVLKDSMIGLVYILSWLLF